MREMKDSGIEWIGEIPADWKTNRLQWHLEELKVQNSPVQCEDVLSLTIEAGVIPYEDKGNQGNKSKENLDEYKLAYPDTLVVNSMNVIIGAVGISKYFGCVSPVYYVFKAASGTDLKYIYYLFTNVGFQKEMRKYTKGILEIRLRISANDMLKLSIPSPSYEEQCLISATLDRICAKIDAVIAKTKATIEEYKKLKQSIITEAVTKGIRGDRPMKDSGIEWIGNVPAEWVVSRFKYVASVESNLVAPDAYLNYPQVSPENIEKGSGKLLPCRTVAEVGVISGNHLFFKGQILYSKIRPKLNKVVIAPFDGLCSADMYPIETSIHKRFFLYSLLSDVLLQQVSLITEDRVKMPKINQEELGNTWFAIPPNEEQNEIADYLDRKCAEFDRLIAGKTHLLEQLESYKKSVIYEYVPGKTEVG